MCYFLLLILPKKRYILRKITSIFLNKTELKMFFYLYS